MTDRTHDEGRAGQGHVREEHQAQRDLVREERRTGRGRWVAYGAGAVLVGIGVSGLLANAASTHPVGWLVWFAGVAVLHDAVVAPLVLSVAVLVGRLPQPWRRVTRTALVPAAVVTLVALPMVLGLGRRADVPSRLPLAYGTNLAAILAAIVLVGAAAVTVSGRSLAVAGRWRLVAFAGLLAASVAVVAAVVL